MNIGLRLERLFEESFRRWGVFVASHPISVMIVSLVISIILAFGLCWWKVTTDPVDLWVSSSSQARQDMNYFNEHFWKFYRIEQVVIAPKNNDTFRFNTGIGSENDGIETFGPAFNQSFLLQAFKLLRDIESLTATDPLDPSRAPVSLDSICFKPLAKDCATQSIFTYFLDDEKYIKMSDYPKRISTCTK